MSDDRRQGNRIQCSRCGAVLSEGEAHRYLCPATLEGKDILRDIPSGCVGVGPTKPLKWRTGPVPHRGVRYLTKESGITSGRVVVKAGWTVDESDAWLPLSEILDLIGG